MSPGGPSRSVAPVGVDHVVTGSPPDASVVARAQAGDAAAFGEIFSAHYAPLCGFAASYVSTPEAAEELVQDLFLHLWATRADWQVHGELRGYLFGAVRNRAINAARHLRVESKLRLARSGDGNGEPDASSIPAHGSGPETADAAVLASEMQRTVRDGIARLPERLRAAMYLRWREGMSNAEIARTLGLSERGVEQRISRAFKRLRTSLAPLR